MLMASLFVVSQSYELPEHHSGSSRMDKYRTKKKTTLLHAAE
jgi:hypothetical protein